ncbi:hypothetical protein [Actinoplanes aureus]|uniref:Uncharacterized protein n=1 Tax=Actinoplanes aureus TaxID=2792083 RepID=A0A931FYM5_9ACTN|nr:hypothetical protein [Actinoplanes aureus]MBG0563760.1 hypothetical protein [Actinoplanes aureus]
MMADYVLSVWKAGDEPAGGAARLRRLIEHLRYGRTLAEIAGDLQFDRSRWRDAIAVSTNRPDRRYQLGRA